MQSSRTGCRWLRLRVLTEVAVQVMAFQYYSVLQYG